MSPEINYATYIIDINRVAWFSSTLQSSFATVTRLQSRRPFSVLASSMVLTLPAELHIHWSVRICLECGDLHFLFS